MLSTCIWSIIPCLVSSVWELCPASGVHFPLAGRICKLYANFKEKLPVQSQVILVRPQKLAYQLVSLVNFSRLVFSCNWPEKPLTITIDSERTTEEIVLFLWEKNQKPAVVLVHCKGLDLRILLKDVTLMAVPYLESIYLFLERYQCGYFDLGFLLL